MGIDRGATWRFEKGFKILHFFFQQFPVGQQLKRANQCHWMI
jgi:hypothetical protein